VRASLRISRENWVSASSREITRTEVSDKKRNKSWVKELGFLRQRLTSGNNKDLSEETHVLAKKSTMP